MSLSVLGSRLDFKPQTVLDFHRQVCLPPRFRKANIILLSKSGTKSVCLFLFPGRLCSASVNLFPLSRPQISERASCGICFSPHYLEIIVTVPSKSVSFYSNTDINGCYFQVHPPDYPPIDPSSSFLIVQKSFWGPQQESSPF